MSKARSGKERRAKRLAAKRRAYRARRRERDLLNSNPAGVALRPDAGGGGCSVPSAAAARTSSMQGAGPRC